MKISVLMENTASRSDLTAEHGLSLFIQSGGRNILFDMGQSGAFSDNGEKMGVDVKTADLAVLSHGHYDHGGGLFRFLQKNPAAPVYVSPYAFGAYYHGAQRYIGLDRALLQTGRIRYAKDGESLAPGVTLYAARDRVALRPADSFGLTRMENGVHYDDDFRHEQYLLLEEDGKRVLVSGCSHMGIENIVHWFRPDVLVGGFHLSGLSPEGEALAGIARRLMDHRTRYYTCHCTGTAQYGAMKRIMGKWLEYLCAGMVLEL